MRRLLSIPPAIAARYVFWLALLAVLTASLLPPVVPLPSTGWDKTNHLLAFATLALLGRLAYRRHRLAALAGLLAYGALIEVLQSLTPYRFAEWGDLLADAIGLAIGSALFHLAAGASACFLEPACERAAARAPKQ